jgi:hypothetical protein
MGEMMFRMLRLDLLRLSSKQCAHCWNLDAWWWSKSWQETSSGIGQHELKAAIEDRETKVHDFGCT